MTSAGAPTARVGPWRDRVDAVNWDTVPGEPDRCGCALTGPLFTADEAAGLYPDAARFLYGDLFFPLQVVINPAPSSSSPNSDHAPSPAAPPPSSRTARAGVHHPRSTRAVRPWLVRRAGPARVSAIRSGHLAAPRPRSAKASRHFDAAARRVDAEVDQPPPLHIRASPDDATLRRNGPPAAGGPPTR